MFLFVDNDNSGYNYSKFQLHAIIYTDVSQFDITTAVSMRK